MSGGGSFGDASWLLQRVASASGLDEWPGAFAPTPPPPMPQAAPAAQAAQAAAQAAPPRKPAPATAEHAEQQASPFAMGIPELANLPFALDGFGDV